MRLFHSITAITATTAITLLVTALLSAPALAFILPYANRTQDFSSWTPATQGDTNTIGMAGATVALPMSISSAESNPAGYAMMTGAVSAQINNTNYNDMRLQRSGDLISSSQWGFAVSPEHWGFAFTYNSPETESGTYVSPNTGDTVKTEVSLKELQFTVARAFLNDGLSIGATFEIAKAIRDLDDATATAYAPGFQFGALYHLHNHILIGASLMPQLTVNAASNPDPETVLPGFNRAVIRPTLLTVGTGWIPNRFFKIGISLTYAGATDNTALLYDQSIATGHSVSLVPRLGVSYVVAEYPNFKVEAAAGTYYESSRISNQSDRLHMTAGLEVNPSFVNLGAGFDVSSGYRNYIISAGIDIVRTARTFDIIPEEKLPSYHGIFPRITKLSPEGLPSGLTADEYKKFGDEGVTEVGKIIANVPENIARKAEGEQTTVQVAVEKVATNKKRAKDKKAADKAGRAKKKGKPAPVASPTATPPATPSGQPEGPKPGETITASPLPPAGRALPDTH